LWSPSLPALYVLQVTVIAGDAQVDDLFTSFGLRQVRVDSAAPRILLNGNPIVFNGMALHEEAQLPVRQGEPAGGPLTSAADIAAILGRAAEVHADPVRVDHHPANQMLPRLTDRLGIAVREELPLYHFTPQPFSVAVGRGIAQHVAVDGHLPSLSRH